MCRHLTSTQQQPGEGVEKVHPALDLAAGPLASRLLFAHCTKTTNTNSQCRSRRARPRPSPAHSRSVCSNVAGRKDQQRGERVAPGRRCIGHQRSPRGRPPPLLNCHEGFVMSGENHVIVDCMGFEPMLCFACPPFTGGCEGQREIGTTLLRAQGKVLRESHGLPLHPSTHTDSCPKRMHRNVRARLSDIYVSNPCHDDINIRVALSTV